MTIRKTKPKVNQALSYDVIFIDKVEITQKRVDTEIDLPDYGLTAKYRGVATDLNGVLHYEDKADTIQINDYMTRAVGNSAKGNKKMLKLIETIQDAVAELIAIETGITTKVTNEVYTDKK